MLTYHDVERFLYREARLMDEHAYDDWLALWTEDAHYWIPCNEDDFDRDRHISLVNEDRSGLEDRIERLKSGRHYAQQPPSRLCRVVGNVEMIESSVPDEAIVHSNFSLTASRKGQIDLLAGRSDHRLRVVESEVKMVSKKVVLVDNDEVIRNLTFLI